MCRVFRSFELKTPRVKPLTVSRKRSLLGPRVPSKYVVPEVLCDLNSMADSRCTSNFFRIFFIVSLNSVSSRPIQQIPLNLMTIVELRLCNRRMPFFPDVGSFTTCSTKLLATINRTWLLPKLLSISSLSLPDHVKPFGGFSCNTVNWVKPVHGPDSSRSPSTFQ